MLGASRVFFYKSCAFNFQKITKILSLWVENSIVGSQILGLKKIKRKTKIRKMFLALDLYCSVSDNLCLSEDLPCQDRVSSSLMPSSTPMPMGCTQRCLLLWGYDILFIPPLSPFRIWVCSGFARLHSLSGGPRADTCGSAGFLRQ